MQSGLRSEYVSFLVSLNVGDSPGRVAQSVGHLTGKSGVLGSIPGLAIYFRFSFRFFKKALVSYWRKYVQEVLVNRLGGLSLPRKSVVRLTDRPDMTLDVYRGCKTTMQQQQQMSAILQLSGYAIQHIYIPFVRISNSTINPLSHR